MVVDDEVDAVDEAAEVVRLHVDHADAVELPDGLGRHDVDVNVEQVQHPEVFRTRHALERTDDGRRLRPAQDVAQREPAGHGIGVRIVVQHDQQTIGVAEVPLILLHAGPGQRSAHLGHQRIAEQLGHREVGDVGKLGVKFLGPFRGGRRADAEQVDQRAARVARGLENLARAAAAVVFDDDAGAGSEVGLEEGVGAAGVADNHVDVGVVQSTSEGAVLNDELDLEPREQDLVEHPDDQLVLADR